MMHGLSNTFLYTAKRVITLWDTDLGQVETSGTGFFVNKGNELYLITNRHVVDLTYAAPKYTGATMIGCRCEGYESVSRDSLPSTYTTIHIKNYNAFVFHNNQYNDIACLKDPESIDGSPSRISLPIDYELLASKEKIDNKLTICDTIAYPGFPKWYDKKNNTPIFRMGTIASDPRVGYSANASDPDADRVAYEGFSSSGSSGSPVFATQRGFPVGGSLKAPDGFYRPVMVVGINAGHYPSDEGHSGISWFYKSSAIIELIDSCT